MDEKRPIIIGPPGDAVISASILARAGAPPSDDARLKATVALS